MQEGQMKNIQEHTLITI